MLKFIFSFIIIFYNFISIGECREVVFVLNGGQSMRASDPFNMAAESIFWATQNFSAEDEVAIVTFKDKVNVIRPLSKIKDKPAEKFFVNYSEQSNAGAGILTALDMLSPKFNMERDIIFITDGEINNSQSSTNFKAGLQQAQWLGISVYLIDLRYNVDPKYYREYSNVKFLPINYNELMTTLRTILQGDWNLPHISLATNNLTSGNLNFEVPVTSADELKISLFSTKAGKAALKNIQSSKSFQGNFIKIFDIKSPATNQIEIAVDYPQGAGLTLDVVPKVSGSLQTNISKPFWSESFLEITPVYAKDSSSKILGDKFFDDKNIKLQINDKNYSGKIQDGVIKIPLEDLEENISLQKIHFEDVGIIFGGDDTAQLVASPNHYGAGLMMLAGVLVIVGLSLRLTRKKLKAARVGVDSSKLFEAEKNIPPIEENFSKTVANENISYKGKLVIYVTRIPEEENIVPHEFNLFRINLEKISLKYVMEKCNLFVNFPNAKNIFISPNDRGIFLENMSDCTITKRNLIVEKGTRVELNYNDSVNISTFDGTSEIIMVYKSLKPN